MCYSALADSAAHAIASNGYKILEMPKYRDHIKTTEIRERGNGLVDVQYLDKDGAIIADAMGGLREWFPMIGEIVDIGPGKTPVAPEAVDEDATEAPSGEMKTWNIYWGGNQPETPISGRTLVEAIEAKFEMIGRTLAIGNVAGWRLDKVWMSYQDGILGGKGGVVLNISAYGSRGLVGYKEEAAPRCKSVCIRADKEDCPAPYTFEIKGG